jgi:MOSC domain-containing protein YiiM
MLFLYGIGIKVQKKAPLEGANRAVITPESGLEGDVRGGGGRTRARQVTLISHEQWEAACAVMGWRWSEYSWMLRRANLCIRGGPFVPEHIGKFVHIGTDAVLQITGETTPCERMDEIAPGLREALAPFLRGGVTCRVVRGGHITTGNNVVIHDQESL